jgi:hypothetical protein
MNIIVEYSKKWRGRGGISKNWWMGNSLPNKVSSEPRWWFEERYVHVTTTIRRCYWGLWLTSCQQAVASMARWQWLFAPCSLSARDFQLSLLWLYCSFGLRVHCCMSSMSPADGRREYRLAQEVLMNLAWRCGHCVFNMLCPHWNSHWNLIANCADVGSGTFRGN